MVKYRIVITILVYIFTAIGENSSAENYPRRNTLEQSWYAFVESARTGQESELAKTMTSYRIATMKNSMASAGISMTPDMIKEMAEFSPDVTSADFVKIFEKGPTAGIVYAKDVEDQGSESKTQVEFTFIKYVKEDGVWKVDGVSNTYMDKFDDSGAKTEFTVADISPEFAIDGQVRKAPEPIKVPEIIGMLDVFSYGYKTLVTINGVEQLPTADMSSSGTIDGGLKKGVNTISIVMTREGEVMSHGPEVKIRRALGDNKVEEVFRFAPADNIEGKHIFNFTVD